MAHFHSRLFFQDVIILQPIQVVLIASLLSVLIRKPVKHDPVHGLPRRKNPCAEDSKVLPPEETVLKTSRIFRTKLQKMFRAILEISLFLFFVLLLLIVCYGNRDTSRYQLTKSLKDVFVKFDKVGGVHLNQPIQQASCQPVISQITVNESVCRPADLLTSLSLGQTVSTEVSWSVVRPFIRSFVHSVRWSVSQSVSRSVV